MSNLNWSSVRYNRFRKYRVSLYSSIKRYFCTWWTMFSFQEKFQTLFCGWASLSISLTFSEKRNVDKTFKKSFFFYHPLKVDNNLNAGGFRKDITKWKKNVRTVLCNILRLMSPCILKELLTIKIVSKKLLQVKKPCFNFSFQIKKRLKLSFNYIFYWL